jgi:hypothetical protein
MQSNANNVLLRSDGNCYNTCMQKSVKDPIVEEVRKHRMEHTLEFGSDLAAICANLRSVQTASGFKVVRLAPKKLSATNVVSHPDHNLCKRMQPRKSPFEGG